MNSYDWLFEDSDIIKDAPEEKSESASFPVEEPIWTTANGDKIPLSKMETRHICNCIKLLESKGKFKHKWGVSEKRKRFLETWYRIFKDELERRRASKLETSFSL